MSRPHGERKAPRARDVSGATDRGPAPDAEAWQAASAGAQQEDASLHLQLIEERLRPVKTLEQAGSVRIRRQIVEREETLTVPVREERATVECLAGSGTVRVGNQELHEGESIEIVLMREEVVIQKRPLVLEELAVHKEVVEHEQQIKARVRREELTVDDPQGLVKDLPR